MARVSRKAEPLARSRKRARASVELPRLLKALEHAHPEATCALTWTNPFELLIATMLSAQCTDARVNSVTPSFFERYPDARALAAAEVAAIETLIRSTGFYRAKAKSLLACSRALMSRHQGRVPTTMAALAQLPGVGRKTANIILGHAFGLSEGIAVDTHVFRVSRRLGLASAETPDDVERELMAIVPREKWTRVSDLLIFHGRKVCGARRPACGGCSVFSLCRWLDRVTHAAAGREARSR